MFILRKITGNGGELNFALGDSYSLILKDKNPKEFKEVLYVNGHNAFLDDIYGFIGYGDSKFHMLFISHFNYIMTENGKTFKNVTSHEKTCAYNRELADGEKHFENVQKLHEEIDGNPSPTENIDNESLPKQKPNGYLPTLKFNLKYSIEDIPGESQTGSRCSEDLLIDIDGTGKIFRVGYYVLSESDDKIEGQANDDEGFRLYASNDEICGGMRWDYLPVKKSKQKSGPGICTVKTK